MGFSNTDGFIETCILLAIGEFTILLRVVARIIIVGVQEFALDDYVMVLTSALFAGICALKTAINVLGGTNNLPELQRLSLSPEEIYRRSLGSKLSWTGWFAYTGVLWSMKVCVICFYHRLRFDHWQGKLLTFTMVFVGVSYVEILFVVFFNCRPLSHNWQVVPDPGPACTLELGFYIGTGLPNVLTDILLFSIPVPILLQARMPWTQKLQLLILFGMGFFIIIATVLRSVEVFRHLRTPQQGPTWAIRECTVAIIVNNVLMIKPLGDRLVEYVISFRRGQLRGQEDRSESQDSNHPPRPPRHRDAFPLSTEMDTTCSPDTAFENIAANPHAVDESSCSREVDLEMGKLESFGEESQMQKFVNKS